MNVALSNANKDSSIERHRCTSQRRSKWHSLQICGLSSGGHALELDAMDHQWLNSASRVGTKMGPPPKWMDEHGMNLDEHPKF